MNSKNKFRIAVWVTLIIRLFFQCQAWNWESIKIPLGTTYSTQKSMATKTRTAARIADFSSCIQNIFFIRTPVLYTVVLWNYTSFHTHTGVLAYFGPKTIYCTRATITPSWSVTAFVYKPRILGLKNEEFPLLVHKLSVI